MPKRKKELWLIFIGRGEGPLIVKRVQRKRGFTGKKNY